MSWSTSELRVRLVPLNVFKPSSNFTTIPRWCFFCGSFFVVCVSYLFLLYCLVCSLQPCDHLGKLDQYFQTDTSLWWGLKSLYCLSHTVAHMSVNPVILWQCQQVKLTLFSLLLYTTGWISPNCTTFDYCNNNTCLNGGSCSNELNTFKCLCTKNFTGRPKIIRCW